MPESYSFSPQFATIRSASPLEGMRPVKAIHTALQFQPQKFLEVKSEQPELISNAWASGLKEGVGDALKGITAAYVTEREKKEKKDEAVIQRAHEEKIARIKAAPTEAEKAYALLRNTLTQKQIDATTARIQEETEDINSTAVEPGEIDFSNWIDFTNQVQEVPAPTATPVSPIPAAPDASVAPPANPKVSRFAPADAGRGLFQFDQTTPIDESGNVIPTEIADTSKQDNLFSNISSITTPAEKQFESGYNLAPPKPREAVLPESVGTAKLQGVSFPLVPVSGAEEKPLAGTPPPAVEPALPEAQPALTATPPAQATQLTPQEKEQARYQIENQLTARPYKSIADARMARQIIQQTLGVKAQISTEKGEKGSRLHYVEITEEPISPMETVPKDMVMKQVVDKEGQLTTTYVPKVPVKQQLATFDNNIEKAKILKSTIEKIEKIAPGYLFAGAGGISGIMQYNPFSNDARTVRKLVDTVKGIVGFDELVALKAAGGTLGALSDSELSMLTSLKGSVDPDLDEATFLSNIKLIKESADKLISGLESDKKELINVEKKTNFQPIQSEKPKYEKGQVAIVNGNSYKWDGNQWNLIQ